MIHNLILDTIKIKNDPGGCRKNHVRPFHPLPSRSLLGTAFLLITSLIFYSGCSENEKQNLSYGELCDASKNTTNQNAQPSPPTEERVNGDMIQKRLFQENIQILKSLNQVQQAKLQIQTSRNQLFPSLNLSALLLSAQDTSFSLSAVQILLPFLVPANWARVQQSKVLYRAQVEALNSMRRNTFASAYSIYQTVLFTNQAHSLVSEGIQDLRHILTWSEKYYRAGLLSKTDLQLAQNALLQSQIQQEELLSQKNQEVALLHSSLGLDPEIQLKIESESVEHPPDNDLLPKKIFDEATQSAAELRQVKALIQASRKETWSRKYAFVGGATTMAPFIGSQSESVAFNNSRTEGYFNFNFGQIPLVDLSEQKTEELKLRELEIQRELQTQASQISHLLQSTSLAIKLSKTIQSNLEAKYQESQNKFQVGVMSLSSLLEARGEFRKSQMNALGLQNKFTQLAIVYQRLTGKALFSKIPICQPPL